MFVDSWWFVCRFVRLLSVFDCDLSCGCGLLGLLLSGFLGFVMFVVVGFLRVDDFCCLVMC